MNQKIINYSCRVNNFAILKELEELKKIIADTKRELEQLRSSLTTSTP